jgi:hypothetical protein
VKTNLTFLTTSPLEDMDFYFYLCKTVFAKNLILKHVCEVQGV